MTSNRRGTCGDDDEDGDEDEEDEEGDEDEEEGDPGEDLSAEQHFLKIFKQSSSLKS